MVVPIDKAPSLAGLLADVSNARTAVRDLRPVVGRGAATREAQQLLCDSLATYTRALARRGLPVPRLLRDELRMYVGVLGGRTDHGGAGFGA
jgi:hypothetical protein